MNIQNSASEPKSRVDIKMSELNPEELKNALNEYGLGELAQSMGIKLTTVSAKETIGTMPVAGNRQPLGLLNGGANALLAETLGSIAANVAAYPDRVAVGVDINVTHLKAVKEGFVTGIATANHLGRSTGNYTIEIFNDKKEKTAIARLSLFFREKGK